MGIGVRRIYEPPEVGDGLRVLVDRLWPRGVAKADAKVDVWAKAITPSTELRRWFHAQTDDAYTEFVARYRAELDAAAAGDVLETLRAHEQVTLLTAVKEPEHSHVPVLLEWLGERGFQVA